MRMDDLRSAKKTMETKTAGKQPRGRPRITWEDNLKDILKGIGVLGWPEARRVVVEGDEWNSLCNPYTER